MTSLPPSCVHALADLRLFLATCWEWTHEVHYARSFPRKDPRPTISSTYMCRHTSRMLLELLDEVDPGWKLAGGTIKTLDERDAQPHWWIEKDGLIIDLTADQFGWEPITVVPTSDVRYQSLPEAASKSWIRGLTTTMATWRGIASRDWMDHDPQFQSLAQASAPALAMFQARWKEGLTPSPPVASNRLSH